jgi:sterol desaturase/sphingolipid hydroxylase (fatty acid hydroxylase superfamily)
MFYLLEFAGFFAFILIFGYLLPAGYYYWVYHLRNRAHQDPIQPNRRPTRSQIIREVKLSVVSTAIFAAMAAATFELYKAGWTRIYWDYGHFPRPYFFISIILAMVWHDFFFYWTHRFMHWRPVFKYLHAAHHRSVSPTPWAIYAFDPAEAALQFSAFTLLVMVIPLHPFALMIFLFLDAHMNTAGHTGFEVVPRFIANHPWFQGFNTVTHHDAHHTNFGKNFGSFFNVWDRWMGTFLDARAPDPHADQQKQPEPRRELIPVANQEVPAGRRELHGAAS